MQFYIATKLENHQAHNNLRDWMLLHGHVITYDWTVHGPAWRNGIDAIMETAEAETKGVLTADVVIVLWPGGRGTHVEMGIALGAGIPVFFMSQEEGHHSACPDVCAFYLHPNVRRSRTHDELTNQLRDFFWCRNRQPVVRRMTNQERQALEELAECQGMVFDRYATDAPMTRATLKRLQQQGLVELAWVITPKGKQAVGGVDEIGGS